MDKSWKMNFPVYCWTQCQRHIGMIGKVVWTDVKVLGILRMDLWLCGERHCGVHFSFLFLNWSEIHIYQGFPGGSEGKVSVCSAGDQGSIHGSGRSLERNWNPLQYSCLENPMDWGAWVPTYSPRGLKESDTSEQLHFLSLSHISTSKV